MSSDNGKRMRFPPWSGMDHLSYLKVHPSLIEENTFDHLRDKDLVCAECQRPVTKVSERIEVFGRHDHAFTNLGYLVQLGCFRDAPGCIGIQRVSHGYSWFRGYAWQIQLCRHCHTQLGWKYMSDEENFYGLIFNMLREEETGEKN